MRAFLKVIMRRKLLLGTSLLVALGFAWVLTDGLPRGYAAEVVLAVDARKVNIVDNEVVSRLPQDNQALRTELDIITSRSLAEHVVDRLGLATDPATLREVGEDRTILGMLRKVAAESVLRRLGVAEVLSTTQSPHPSRTDVVDWLLSRLIASNDNKSFTIFVAFKSESPERATRIANAVAQGYLDDQVSLKAATTHKASGWLAQRTGEVRQEVAVADAAVTDFRRVSGLIEAKGVTVVGQQLSELNTQLALARAERARAEGRLQMARTNNGSSLPDVLNSVTIQGLRAQLTHAEVRLAENANNVTLPNLLASVTSLKAQIVAETARIVAGIAGEAEAARAKEASLTTSIQDLQSAYGQISTGEVRLNQLQRDADANQAIYEALLTRYKQAIGQESLATPDARIIAEAQVQTIPVFPKRLPIFLIAGLFGLFLGGIAAFVRERLDDRIREVGRLDLATGIPVLATMPRAPRLIPFPFVNGWHRRGSTLGVALQWLQATLQSSKVPSRVQVVLVTSAMAAEGKTSLCVCLAREFARTGMRVLVIDADPYRSRVASAFGGSARPNLNLIAAGTSRIQDVAQTDQRSGAQFVAAASPEQFHGLIRNAAFARFVEEARSNYDIVLLDTAPVLAGADVAIIGRLADLRLFVVRCGWTAWDQMMSALTSLQLSGSIIDGLVVTGAGRRDHYYSRLGIADAALSGRQSFDVRA